MTEFTNPNLDVLISADEIQQRIREMGADIARDYAGQNPLLIGVLKGAFIFLSDLMRAAPDLSSLMKSEASLVTKLITPAMAPEP